MKQPILLGIHLLAAMRTPRCIVDKELKTKAVAFVADLSTYRQHVLATAGFFRLGIGIVETRSKCLLRPIIPMSVAN